MANIPIIKKWEIYFNRMDGLENRKNVAVAFTEYWNGHSFNLFEIPGKCMLGGKVYGREGFIDGNEIFTSFIRSIRRIETGFRNGIPHDLMLATTYSGSLYHIYSDDYNAYMALMLGDITHTGRLNDTPGYYLDRNYRGSRLF